MMLQENCVTVTRFCLNVVHFKKPACSIQKGNLDLIFIKGNSCLDPCQSSVKSHLSLRCSGTFS